jgi:PAS domain S-box-containing protein
MESATGTLAELAQAEERMRSVVNHVVDGIISIDEQGTVTTFNPAAERIFGYSGVEVIGQNVKLLMPEPFHSEHDGYIANYLRTGQAKIIGIGREVVGRRKNGTTFPMELAISVFRLGERRHFTGIVRDITDRKRAEEELRQAEERFRELFESIDQGFCTIEVLFDESRKPMDYRFLIVNPAFERQTGIKNAVGRRMREIAPMHEEHWFQIYGEIALTGRARRFENPAAQLQRYYDVYAWRVGEPAEHRVAMLFNDITARKQTEEALREADRQKNEFLAMLAHELRNPLAPMRNALHLMKMPGAEGGVINQARDMMERQMHQLVRLVDDLLDVSRIIRGKIELRREPVDLAMAVARAVETAQPVVESQGHQLTVSLPPERVWVAGDLIRLSQVLANLITNAAKYTEKAGQIWIELEREREEAVIRVRDTGAGISAALQPHVFDLFVQGEHSLARSQGGLGIGLTLVKRLVEMHGGRVAVASDGANRGSQFTVRLPVLAEGQSAERMPAAGAGAGAAGPLAKRVLVVDDNVDAADSIAMILRLTGYDVRCVYDGPSVLEAAKVYRPDVVVLDIGLPGLSGYDVAKKLREQPEFRCTPLVAVTGYGQEEDRRRSKEAGFDCHLTKPVDPFALQAFVARPGSYR